MIHLYDAAIVTLIVVSAVGMAWAGYQMSKHSRDVRVYRQVRVEMPHGVWPLVPKPLEPKSLPRWMTKAAAYLLPAPKREK